jgi:hypothetical protein
MQRKELHQCRGDQVDAAAGAVDEKISPVNLQSRFASLLYRSPSGGCEAFNVLLER